MSLSSNEIAAVVARLARDLDGAAVQQVLSPERPERLVLVLRTPGQTHHLQIVVAGPTSRLGRIEKPRTAPQPHPFAMLLRRDLAGCRLAGVTQQGGDRAVRLRLDRGEGTVGHLVAELTARHGNLLWLGSDDVIRGPLLPNRSRLRKLVPGERYDPPRPGPGRPRDAGERFPADDRLEEAIEEHYARVESAEESDRETAALARLARAAIRRLERLVRRLDEDLRRAGDAESLAAQGELLKANLHRARRGMKQLEVVDFTGQPAVVRLDPRLEPVANMKRLFDRSRRLRRARDRIAERRDRTVRERDRMRALAAEIDTADAAGRQRVLEAITARFPGLARRAARQRGKAPERSPYREVPIAHGRSARVGRSAADNDALTLRHSAPDDLWLHVRGRRGSHVTVPLGRGEEPDGELLIDAAHLAAHFSEARGDSDVEVTYTRRRYVQKPRGAAPGSVRLLKEKTVLVRVEPDRLARLLGQEG